MIEGFANGGHKVFKGALIVGIGGFVGSIARYLSTQFIHKYIYTAFPVGTLAVNIVGCLLIGVFMGISEKGGLMSDNLRLFLTVGFCGGFTTFSAFSNDSLNLINDSEFLYFSLYLGISIFTGIAATYFGKNAVNWLWS